ncbi:hypothetical protein [Kutzneria buriramensis]|uniref:Uncharacterized protein n=1 Tax=Kutzneria buriramensis TaxID=1045776 RepID=A0A3E0HAQ0_9PSEU|nr:hypothetical protein [Kutzneria buriramensis]REH41113.1 hypothetical protein BCF44_112195 [Kutzneria buriramensis]
MQQPWGTDPELRDHLVWQFVEWAGQRADTVVHVEDAITALDWSSLGPSAGAFRWTASDVDRFLLEYLPERLALPATVCANGALTLGPLLHFLARAGMLSPDSDLPEEIEERCEEVWEAAEHRASYDVAAKALFQHVRGGEELTFAEQVSRVRTMPADEVKRVLDGVERRAVGPLRLPNEREQAFAAERAPVFVTFAQLRQACGEDGIELVDKGQLPENVAMQLGMGGSELAWALAAGAVRRFKGRLVRVAAWQKLERYPLNVIRKAFAAQTRVPRRSLAQLSIELVRAAVARRSVDLAELPAPGEVVDFLMDCGLMFALGGEARLTACGMPILVDLAEENGLLVRVLPPPQWANVDELIAAIAAAGDEWADDVREWSLEQPERHTARILISRIATPDRPTAHVMVAIQACGDVFGDRQTVPPVRLLLGGPHDGPALLWLLRHKALDEGDVPAVRIADANVAELAGLLDSGGVQRVLDAVADHGDTARTVEFLNLVWRSDHPRTCEVLLVIAEHYGDDTVAAHAQKLAERHRGWHTRG